MNYKPKLTQLSTSFFALLSEIKEDADDLNLIFETLNSKILEFKSQTLLAFGDSELTNDASILLCSITDEMLLNLLGVGWDKYRLLMQHHQTTKGSAECKKILDFHFHEYNNLSNVRSCELLALFELAISYGWRGHMNMLPDVDAEARSLKFKLHDIVYGDVNNETLIQHLTSTSLRNVDRRQRLFAIFIVILLVLFASTSILYVEYSINKIWKSIAVENHKQGGLKSEVQHFVKQVRCQGWRNKSTNNFNPLSACA